MIPRMFGLAIATIVRNKHVLIRIPDRSLLGRYMESPTSKVHTAKGKTQFMKWSGISHVTNSHPQKYSCEFFKCDRIVCLVTPNELFQFRDNRNSMTFQLLNKCFSRDWTRYILCDNVRDGWRTINRHMWITGTRLYRLLRVTLWASSDQITWVVLGDSLPASPVAYGLTIK